jgi:hypothetical protein
VCGNIEVRLTGVPEHHKKMIKKRLAPGIYATMINSLTGDRFVICLENDKPVAKKIVTMHDSYDGNPVSFDLSQESDGSIRLIDLAPAIVDLTREDSQKVYFVDEIERSLHSLLIEKLIKIYFDSCSEESRSQLIFTTHNLTLMDQKLFRRDEMWAMERTLSGGATLFPFSDFQDIRYDKDVRKSYLQGRLGGVPNIDT